MIDRVRRVGRYEMSSAGRNRVLGKSCLGDCDCGPVRCKEHFRSRPSGACPRLRTLRGISRLRLCVLHPDVRRCLRDVARCLLQHDQVANDRSYADKLEPAGPLSRLTGYLLNGQNYEVLAPNEEGADQR